MDDREKTEVDEDILNAKSNKFFLKYVESLVVLCEGEEKKRNRQCAGHEKRADLLQAKPLLTGCGGKGLRARDGGFRSCSNYFSPQTTEAIQGPRAQRDIQIRQPSCPASKSYVVKTLHSPLKHMIHELNETG